MEKKIWHDARTETPTDCEYVILICEDVDGDIQIIKDAKYGIPEKATGEYTWIIGIGGYFKNAEIAGVDLGDTDGIDIPDYSVYYSTIIYEFEEEITIGYNLYTKPIKWAYTNDIDNMLIEMSKEN